MKANPSLAGRPKNDRRPLANAAEWTVLVIVVAMGVFFFLSSNGFIDSSSIQPYPY